jgi:hypothetical protein
MKTMKIKHKDILSCGRWSVDDLQLDGRLYEQPDEELDEELNFSIGKTFDTSKRARSYAKSLFLRDPNHTIILTATKSFKFDGEYLSYKKKEWVVTLKDGKVKFKSNGFYYS